MKQKKNTPLIVPVLWFITTGLWTITFSMNLLHFSLSEGIVGLHGCWSHWLPPSSISAATNKPRTKPEFISKTVRAPYLL